MNIEFLMINSSLPTNCQIKCVPSIITMRYHAVTCNLDKSLFLIWTWVVCRFTLCIGAKTLTLDTSHNLVSCLHMYWFRISGLLLFYQIRRQCVNLINHQRALLRDLMRWLEKPINRKCRLSRVGSSQIRLQLLLQEIRTSYLI